MSQDPETKAVTNYDSVNCTEFIDDNQGLSDEEKKALKEELILPGELLCPNITQFTIKGGILGSLRFVIWAQANTTLIETD